MTADAASLSVLAAFSLDQERSELAMRVDRNALVLAGPGAGKTHLLVAHACWLAERNAGRVVLLTYSRKAAGEMKRRADAALPVDVRRLVVASTIHAHALELIRAHGHRIGLGGDIEPIDSKDVQVMADEVARREGVPAIEDFAARFEKYQRLHGNLSDPNLPQLVGLVDREMRARGRLDWDSCIRIATDLLTRDASVRESTRHHDRSVLLDEAQDCDAGQLAFLEQLVGPAPGERHLFVVMDPDQSLYAFRQANPELVRSWAFAYAGEETEVTENFRCAPRVQALAKHVLEKPWSGPMSPGVTVLKESSDRASEAAWICSNIISRLQAGKDARRIAVLARRRSRLSVVEAALASATPVRSDAREKWTPPEERILAAIAFVKDWRDGASSNGIATTFLVDVARLGVDESRRIEQQALAEQRHPGDLLTVEWWRALAEWLEERRSPEQIVERVAPIAHAESGDLRALLALAHQARSLGDLLKLARAGPDPSHTVQGTGVLVTSFHGAKGLEFDVVYVVGCEDGTIPDFRARDEKEVRDERRGLYVAITRASESVILTWVTSDNGYPKQLTRFLPAAMAPIWMPAE